jgi:hypothetical protein
MNSVAVFFRDFAMRDREKASKKDRQFLARQVKSSSISEDDLQELENVLKKSSRWGWSGPSAPKRSAVIQALYKEGTAFSYHDDKQKTMHRVGLMMLALLRNNPEDATKRRFVLYFLYCIKQDREINIEFFNDAMGAMQSELAFEFLCYGGAPSSLSRLSRLWNADVVDTKRAVAKNNAESAAVIRAASLRDFERSMEQSSPTVGKRQGFAGDHEAGKKRFAEGKEGSARVEAFNQARDAVTKACTQDEITKEAESYYLLYLWHKEHEPDEDEFNSKTNYIENAAYTHASNDLGFETIEKYKEEYKFGNRWERIDHLTYRLRKEAIENNKKAKEKSKQAERFPRGYCQASEIEFFLYDNCPDLFDECHDRQKGISGAAAERGAAGGGSAAKYGAAAPTKKK